MIVQVKEMKIIECRKMDAENYSNITFIRIESENLSVTIKDIIASFSNKAWISQFDEDYQRKSFAKRADETANFLAEKLREGNENGITKNTGEYVVSELARQALVEELEYLDVPLAELFKEKVSGNPGFDFYSANRDKIIIFGEAKYSSRQNAYGKGMEQVDRFISQGQDISDLNDIDKFFEASSLNAASNGDKAYAVAFAAKTTKSDDLIDGIVNNKHYSNLVLHKELVFLAVNI